MPGLTAKLTDWREVCAYVLPHLAAIGWGVAVSPWIYSKLQTGGYRMPLWPGLVLSVGVGLAVLVAFLYLRRSLHREPGEDRLGFALGLALLTFTVLTLWYGVQNRSHVIQTPVSPGGLATFIGGSLGTFVGAFAACGWTRDSRNGYGRALFISLIVALIAFPVAALVILLEEAINTTFTVGHLLPAFSLAVFVGGAVFGLPCLVVTFLWCLLYFRLIRTAR